MKPTKLLCQGAEAKIILVSPRPKKFPAITKSSRSALMKSGAEQLIASHSEPIIIKDRIKKSYRLPELDTSIRKSRTRSETKLLQKAHQIIPCPLPLTDRVGERFHEGEIKNINNRVKSRVGGARGGGTISSKIKMPFIDGKKLSEHLDNFSLKEQKQICKIIGQEIAKLHDADIIHGDLTTSNMILLPAHSRSQFDKINNVKTHLAKSSSLIKSSINRASAPIIFFIDFGLGYISRKIEDKAVDLHLLKQALEAKHFKNWKELFEKVIEGYKKENKKEAQKVLERLKAVEKRGRYKKH